MSDQPRLFHLRRAIPTDAEGICRMHVESIRTICAADYTPQQIEAWAGPKKPQDYVDYLAGGSFMLVAESNAEIAGFAALEGNEVKAVYVSPRTQRIGIGRALLAAIESEATQRGLSMLTLESTITARRFYERHGYAFVSDTTHCMCAVDVPCMRMTKELNIEHPTSNI